MPPSTARHHAEWLSLIEVSGPFLSLPVLLRVFPQGLDADDTEHARDLRLAAEEWQDNQLGLRPRPDMHKAWIDFVLRQTLELPDEVVAEGQEVPQTLKATVSEHGETLRPDIVVKNPESGDDPGKPRLLIQTYPLSQDLEKPVPDRRWKASPDTRMTELLHATDVQLGLVTNGERWMLVFAPRGETTGYASWYASLWLEERLTLRAFRSLLGVHRFLAVADDETLAPMLAESAENQHEVTDQLGLQVRHAVEVLVQTLDRADQDRGGKLLARVPETVLYEAALTVMMRLVFLFCAEERDLLLLGDPLYDEHYAVSTLGDQLQAEADEYGEEVLERRGDAWCRLLTTFRMVYGGVWHDRMTLPAYAGGLFDPDRFPFLEGRSKDSSWRHTPADPLPVDNRTVLHLLRSLQYLEMKVPGGGAAESRRLSFRALDIEQIGHVYEGLLDHTAKRTEEPILGLQGAKGKEPEISLGELERLRGVGEDELIAYLKKETGRSPSALKKALQPSLEPGDTGRLRGVCGNDEGLLQRILPFAGLLRDDSFGYPVVVGEGSVYVTAGTDRRSSGTHYTPRSLTDPIVQYTLEPLVYAGPADGKPKEEWQLRPAQELLDLKVCDMACGSGAFLVQACRYLSERVVEAWEEAESRLSGVPGITPFGQPANGEAGETIIPKDTDERMAYARRLVAQRCLYGVDINPLAVEMAKLSLWLLTLAKNKPFTFLDHAIRPGDSLVGVWELDQLEMFNLDRDATESRVILAFLRERVAAAIELRRRIEERPADKPEDVAVQEVLMRQAEAETERLKCVGDFLVSADFSGTTATERESALTEMAIQVTTHFHDSDADTFRRAADTALEGRPTFHWPLEFPEVVADRGGFDALVCNPPFMGGQKITGNLGTDYREYLVQRLAGERRGSADLCAYFFLRAGSLLRNDGQFGFLATNTIAQGDTREVGLDQLTANGCNIPRADPSTKWPGDASLEVAVVHVRRGAWNGAYVLDERSVKGITPYLVVPGTVTGDPYRLTASAGKSFQGSIVLGIGFTLDPPAAERLIAADARNRDVLKPYLSGDDIASRPDQSPSRWVINFFDWPLNRNTAPEGYDGPVAADYPDCLAIVEQRVKPERSENNDAGARQHWWRFLRPRPELYASIAEMSAVLVGIRVSKYVSFTVVEPSIVFADSTNVFAIGDQTALGLLHSSQHEAWARRYSSTLETRLRYAPADCFETFPFPTDAAPYAVVGTEHYRWRRQIMLDRQEGLTAVYNRFHDPSEAATDIGGLRDLQVALDQAVSEAYGWTDLDLGHGFHETKQGLRYTISEEARREVLDRLLQLNHERYEEEVRQGLHDKKKGRKKAKSPPRGGLFTDND